MSLTRAQRKAIREAGPYRFDDEGVLLVGGVEVAFDQEREEAVLDALNEHVDTPESVAVARERLCKAARDYYIWNGDAATLRLALHDAARTYGKVLRAAKKTRKT